MIENIQVRILWLSDIHFRDIYEIAGLKKLYESEAVKIGNEENTAISEAKILLEKKFLERKRKITTLKSYFDNFISTIKEYPHEIDYVLITGDLAFTGTKEDYNAFYNSIIDELKSILPTRVQFLTIPGNHDVYWANTSFFDSYFEEIKKLSEERKLPGKKTSSEKKLTELRNSYLAKRSEFFKEVFSNYTDFFKNRIKGQLGKANAEACNYDKEGLYGYIIDKEKNLAINFLNSSWYALGQQFDRLLIKSFAKQFADNIYAQAKVSIKAEDSSTREDKIKARQDFDKGFLTCLKELIQIKNITGEYGGQVVGIDKENELNTFKKVLEHSDCFVITTFHHPMNWLQLNETYSKDVKKNDDLFLNKLLNRTDLLLTGHEHAPTSISNQKINERAIHLKGGMFMQDDMYSNEREGQFRFSILEINTSKFKFNERKYFYNEKSATWNYDEKFSKENILLGEKQPVFKKQSMQHYINELQKKEVFTKILNKYFFVNENISANYKSKNLYSTADYSLIQFSTEGTVRRVLVIVKSSDFFGKILKKDTANGSEHIFTSIFKKIKNHEKALRITLLTPDFLVCNEKLKDYIDPKISNKREVYYEIVKKGDFIFNISRHRFFIQFESKIKATPGIKKIMCNDIIFENIKNIQLSSQIIPFWIIEKFSTS